jgi:DNA-binding NarL/FixJ family response regulator
MSVENLYALSQSSVNYGTSENPAIVHSTAARPDISQNAEPRSNIAIVDPRGLMRECLMRLIANYRKFAVIGYPSIDDMINCENSRGSALVILYPVAQANQSALNEISRLKSAYSSSMIIVLVETSDYGSVKRLLQQGVRGIVPITFSTNVVLEVISFVVSGGTFVPAESFLEVPQSSGNRPEANGFGLTNREGQIVSLLRTGQPNKQIAYELGLSIGTVKVHLHNIMKKLGTSNRVQALAHLSPDAAAGR